MRVLWREERERFRRALERPGRHRERRKALMLVLYDAGCRVAEGVAIDLSDFDEQRRSIHIINVKAKDHPRREVPLHDDTYRAVRAWLRVRPKSGSTALFVSQEGTRLSVRQVQREYNAMCRRAGIEPQGVHTLRHTMITRNLDDRILDVHQVSRRAGHRSIGTTYKFYVHGSVESEGDAVRSNRLN